MKSTAGGYLRFMYLVDFCRKFKGVRNQILRIKVELKSCCVAGLHQGARQANDEEGLPPLHHLRRCLPAGANVTTLFCHRCTGKISLSLSFGQALAAKSNTCE